MSSVLSVGAAVSYDGATVVDLADAVYDPATRRYSLVQDNPGLIPLWTFAPLGARDVWLQAIVPVGIGLITLAFLFPDGNELTPLLGGSRAFNLVVPQGTMIKLDSADAGTVTFWMYGIHDKNFADLPCCHQYNPKLMVQPAPP